MASTVEDNTEYINKQPNKKRYKKLWKRATNIPETLKSEVYGISTHSEWLELQELHKAFGSNQSLVGTCVHWRHGKAKGCVESADHRDILHRLMHPSSSQSRLGKKRKFGESDEIPNIPSWATLTNPHACEHVCVIELHCGYESLQQLSSLEVSFRDHLVELSTRHKRHVFSTKVRWFQDDQQPACMTRAVMYRARPKPSKDKAAQRQTVKDKGDLYSALYLWKLKPSELARENYPTQKSDSLTSYSDMARSVDMSKFVDKKPSDIDFECAKKFIQTFSFPVEENEMQLNTQYVASKTWGEKHNRVFAVDCEMVRTKVGLELARITLIEVEEYSAERDIVYKLVFDEIVKPVNRVIDYLTMYSGMTKDIIDNATVTLEQVQAALVATIQCDDILIGHSLENDLRAMRFVHRTVVDTAILFLPSSGRFKYSLRALAARLLRLQIQKSSSHCSLEDAATALKLASRRAIVGPSFQMWDATPINRVHTVASSGHTTVCIGPSEWIQQHITSQRNSIHALGCESIKESNHKAVCSWIAGPSRRARLVWASFDLHDPNDWTRLKDITVELVANMSSATVLTFMIQGGYRKASDLSNVRKARKNPKTTIPWTEEDEATWRNMMDLSQVGTCFWVGTSNNQN
ncbi:RNA exonuclease 1 [Fistulifera solaris]|uniref:RNA exonuclease 1 n=1 Tax=Fistulifera solaris TaxID=1519565 RepID=A0A1Z5J8P3_FISSO|nr:RNA exonuclease 1 [Fistulifera solaris]|eukprot:GAX10357.1 RNA exonuclease 1 [Fistulifera solaris]